MQTKKLLITGGAGFIGSHLTEHFVQKGWQVRVLDNCSAGNKIPVDVLQKIQFIEGDVREYGDVHEAVRDTEVVIHLAAVVGVDEVIHRETETIETETLGMNNLARAATHFGVQRIVYASSSAVYDKIPNGVSLEGDPLCLINAYAIAKRLNEKYLGALTQETSIATNALRFFNIYGARQDERMVIPRFFKQAISNQEISVFGDGNQTRDFTYIDDVVRSIDELISNQAKSGIFNISRGIETNIKTLATQIKSITQSDSIIELLHFPEDRIAYKVDRRIGGNQKLYKQTKFKPSILLEEGLQRYYSSLNLGQKLQARQNP